MNFIRCFVLCMLLVSIAPAAYAQNDSSADKPVVVVSMTVWKQAEEYKEYMDQIKKRHDPWLVDFRNRISDNLSTNGYKVVFNYPYLVTRDYSTGVSKSDIKRTSAYNTEQLRGIIDKKGASYLIDVVLPRWYFDSRGLQIAGLGSFSFVCPIDAKLYDKSGKLLTSLSVDGTAKRLNSAKAVIDESSLAEQERQVTNNAIEMFLKDINTVLVKRGEE